MMILKLLCNFLRSFFAFIDFCMQSRIHLQNFQQNTTEKNPEIHFSAHTAKFMLVKYGKCLTKLYKNLSLSKEKGDIMRRLFAGKL